jgi:hypothetical protein
MLLSFCKPHPFQSYRHVVQYLEDSAYNWSFKPLLAYRVLQVNFLHCVVTPSAFSFLLVLPVLEPSNLFVLQSFQFLKELA